MMTTPARQFAIQADYRTEDGIAGNPVPAPTLIVVYTVPPPIEMQTFGAGEDNSLTTPSEEDGYMESLTAKEKLCARNEFGNLPWASQKSIL